MKTKHCILILIAFGALCFFLGRSTRTTKETVKYVKGETVHDSIPVPYPVKEYIPSDPELIYRERIVYRDTGKTVIREVDSLAILKDWITEREYYFNVYDDEYGVMDVNQVIQYNRLQKFRYTHTPIQKVITKHKEPLFTPFISGSYNTFGTAGVGGGIFYHDIGVEYNYLINDGETGHMVGLKVKF